MTQPSFRFIDLFAGIGGFHAAMKAYGGACVYAVEIDKQAANIYEANWGHKALGDITQDADADLEIMNVHRTTCSARPFHASRSRNRALSAAWTRPGAPLFFNIALIIQSHHPKVVLLENVRNLIGPRHEHEWEVIIETLRDEGLPRLRPGGRVLPAPASARSRRGSPGP
jgi:DNA (cytosine-5)-methyltransferase 1